MRVFPFWVLVSPQNRGKTSLIVPLWAYSSPATVLKKLKLKSILNLLVVEPNALIYMGKDKYESKLGHYII